MSYKVYPGIRKDYFNEIKEYIAVLYFLAWRDFKVRYKQTSLGFLWAVIKPTIAMIMFTVVFAKIGKFPSGNAPYPLLVFCGLLPWQFFQAAFSSGSGSVMGNGQLIKKVYFPKIFLPLSSIFTALIDFVISCSIFLCMFFYYQYPLHLKIFLFPIFLIPIIIFAAGLSLFMSGLFVKYRDLQHLSGYLIQFGMFVSPVGFLSSVVDHKYHTFFYLNPIAGAIDGFRWAILDGVKPNYDTYMLGLVTSLLFAVIGYLYFRKVEHEFADII